MAGELAGKLVQDSACIIIITRIIIIIITIFTINCDLQRK